NMRRASINKRLSASINIGIINLAATFSSCLSRVSHPDCRATGWYNLSRRHSAISYYSPIRYKAMHRKEMLAASELPTAGRRRG
ncbi:hypothetical protein, partial [Paraburkholderia sp. NMBU_R16]|uniref:hypothetical protein n=1 Tax=Paraburkholderia sp. NMBU_R16 TaxID=2698676 RepID=UPI001C26E0D9